MPEPSSPWDRESDMAPRERKMTQGHATLQVPMPSTRPMHPRYCAQRRKRIPAGGEGAPEERAWDPAQHHTPRLTRQGLHSLRSLLAYGRCLFSTR